jgi:hypothetical protein
MYIKVLKSRWLEMRGRSDLVYLPHEIFQIAESARDRLGMNRTAFYRYCIVKVLDEMGLLKERINERKESTDPSS